MNQDESLEAHNSRILHTQIKKPSWTIKKYGYVTLHISIHYELLASSACLVSALVTPGTYDCWNLSWVYLWIVWSKCVYTQHVKYVYVCVCVCYIPPLPPVFPFQDIFYLPKLHAPKPENNQIKCVQHNTLIVVQFTNWWEKEVFLYLWRNRGGPRLDM